MPNKPRLRERVDETLSNGAVARFEITINRRIVVTIVASRARVYMRGIVESQEVMDLFQGVITKAWRVHQNMAHKASITSKPA